jgi:chromosome segregation ATPase
LQSRIKSEEYRESIAQIEEVLSKLLEQKIKMEEQVHAASRETDEIQTHLENMNALFSSLQKDEERSSLQYV